MPSKIAKIAVLAIGLGIALLGSLGGVWYITLPLDLWVRHLDSLAMDTVGVAFIALSLGLGLSLAWQGWNSLRGRPSRPFRLWPAWVLAMAFVLAVAMGEAILSLDSFPPLAFPLLHILTAALPPLIILAFARRRLAGIRWRDVILQSANGALLAPLGAAVAEALSILTLTLVVLTATTSTPSGVAWLQELLTNLQNPAWFANPEALYKLLLSPPILLILSLTLTIIAPLIEESLKPLGVIIMSYRRPSKAQSFLWGLAGGAGFALTENLSSGAIALDAWGMVMLMRIGCTAMHCLGGGLMGLGWYYFLIAHRPWLLAGAYVASIGSHAIWNATAGGLVLIFLTLTSASGELGLALGGLGVLLLSSFLILQSLAAFLLIYYIAKGIGSSSGGMERRAPSTSSFAA